MNETKPRRPGRTIPVRVGHQIDQVLREAAHAEGVPVSQFMREAALARAFLSLTEKQGGFKQMRTLLFKLAKRTQDPEIMQLIVLLTAHSEQSPRFATNRA